MLKAKQAGKPKYLKQGVAASPKEQEAVKDAQPDVTAEKRCELKSIARKWGFYDSGNQADMQGLLDAVKTHRPSKSLKPLTNPKQS